MWRCSYLSHLARAIRDVLLGEGAPVLAFVLFAHFAHGYFGYKVSFSTVDGKRFYRTRMDNSPPLSTLRFPSITSVESFCSHLEFFLVALAFCRLYEEVGKRKACTIPLITWSRVFRVFAVGEWAAGVEDVVGEHIKFRRRQP